MSDEFYHKDIFGAVVDIDLGEQEEEPEVSGPKKRQDFNVFSLTDAFGSRNKKEAWILYQKALSVGLSTEEVFFKIVWQVKSMLLVARTENIEETDMKAFPYNKAKSFLKNFKPGELERISESLVVGYILARQGKGEIETLIEKILLDL